MALKIRLRQQGRKNRPSYRLVLTQSRNPRDGKYIEMLGWYNPFEQDVAKGIEVSAERVEHWLSQGAIITDKAAILLKKSCPQVIESYRSQLLARQAKKCEKRKALKKKKAA